MQEIIPQHQQIKEFFTRNFRANIKHIEPNEYVHGKLSGEYSFLVETDYNAGSSFWVFTSPEIMVYPCEDQTPAQLLEKHLSYVEELQSPATPPTESIADPRPAHQFAQDLQDSDAVPLKRLSAQQDLTAQPKIDSVEYDQGTKFTIGGTDMQYVEATLIPGDKIIGECGSLLYMTQGIEMKTVALNKIDGQSFGGKLLNPLKRIVSGEEFLVSTYENVSQEKETVAFAPPYPGAIIPIDLSQYGKIVCQRGAFLCGTMDLSVSMYLTKKIAVGLWSGQGFFLQKITGLGSVFLHVGGNLVTRELAPGRIITVESGALAAWEECLKFNISMNKGLNLFGGEGIWMTTLKNENSHPAHLWIQSLPFPRVVEQINEFNKKQKKGK